MKDKEKDKRLLIPKDAFEEEASEGLGRLSREEAEADLRELKGRMERRLRKPRMIWLPAAAAVVILLVASALYVSVFRDRSTGLNDLASAEKARPEEAMAESLLIAEADEIVADTDLTAMNDTLMIAMAAPIEKHEGRSGLTVSDSGVRGDISSSDRKAVTKPGVARAGAAVTREKSDVKDEELFAVIEDRKKEVEAEEISEVVVAEAQHEEPLAEEVIVASVPMMQKAALREMAGPEEKPAKEKKAAQDVKAVIENRAATRPEAVAVTAAAGTVTVVTDRAPLPVGGTEEFTQWLKDNVIYPGEVEPQAGQEVVVTFRVRADSTVYDLKAVRTAGDLFTREAFRLIREGPEWLPAVRNGKVVEEEVTVAIVFR